VLGADHQTSIRTGSHKIAQYICLTAPSVSIIGEMVVWNCARRLAGRIFVSRGSGLPASGRAARPAGRTHASSTNGVILSTSVNILNSTVEDYQTNPTILAKTNPKKVSAALLKNHQGAPQSRGRPLTHSKAENLCLAPRKARFNSATTSAGQPTFLRFVPNYGCCTFIAYFREFPCKRALELHRRHRGTSDGYLRN